VPFAQVDQSANVTPQPIGQRVRDVRQGPDGWLYLLTDSAQGKLLRLLPAP
jgi:glucose/arabinose dehydrogenase